MELLTPVKNLQNAKIAIRNGADSIYLASISFGARVHASIGKEELKEIIKLCNDFNVKTFVTFNIVVFDNELEKFFQEIDLINSYGATGIIIQDFSLIRIIKEKYPELEIHASTQMNIQNKDSIKLIESLGVNQVVVPREMSFENIKNLKRDTNIKIESFVHGALCVCYSGQCYDSTLLDQKSANRGRCSQYCRMPSKVFNKEMNNFLKGDYPLNLKDLNNIENLDKYETSGVDVLKVEGRLKGIDYAGYTTKLYKESLEGKNHSKEELKRVYNREFTEGRISGINGRKLVNLNRPNNNGFLIGSVKKTVKNTDKKFLYYKYKIFLNLDYELYKGDNLRFIKKEETGQMVEQFYKDSQCYVLYSNLNIKENTMVFKTKDQGLIDDYLEKIKDINQKRLKIEVDIDISLNLCKVSLNDKVYNLEIEAFKAEKRSILPDDILKVLAKTKNTDYDIIVKSLKVEDNLFIQNKNLKKLRDEIINLYTKSNGNSEKIIKVPKIERTINKLEEDSYYFSVRKKEQLNFFLERKINLNINILIHPHLAGSIKNSKILSDIKKKYKTFLILPRIVYDDYKKEVDELVSYFDNLCLSEIGSSSYIKEVKGEVISNFSLNTTNQINQEFLKELGIDKQILSIELNKEKIEKFDKNLSIVNIYGSIPVMIMDYCPINKAKGNTCGNCRLCREDNYSIKDNLKRNFPLRYEGNNKIGLYSEDVINLIDEKVKLDQFKNFQLNIVDEGEEELEKIINSLLLDKNLLSSSFKGNFYKEVL